MAITRISRSFKDISLSFKRHPVTNDIVVLKNADAIKRSVRNLVQTIPTERFFNSIIGTEVRASLFENYTRNTLFLIEDQIKQTIQNFEPRVDNVRIEASSSPDTNNLDIKVLFDIVGLETPLQSFSFILEPTR